MRRVRVGESMCVEGLWMTPEEAALVKQELLARRTKQAERLARAIGFPSREWGNGSSFDDDERKGDEKTEAMRQALREIENRAATALANQPGDADECGRHLSKALAVIELKAHVARWGREGYPPPYNQESPGAGRGIPSTAKRGSESGLQPPSREAVAQEGTRSNTA